MTMTLEAIIDLYIQALDIRFVEDMPLLNADGIFYSDSRGKFIFIDPTLETKERIWTKAHELGHDRTFQDRSDTPEAARRNEHRADRFAYQLIMPPKKLLQGLQACDNIDELSDRLMITPQRIWNGLRMYEGIYGPYVVIDSCALYWAPLRYVRIEAS